MKLTRKDVAEPCWSRLITRYCRLLGCLSLVGMAVLASAADNQPIATKVGKSFSLTLDSNPTTGYHWRLAKPLDGKRVKLVTNVFVSPQSKLMGAGGKETWKFKALGKGKTSIALEYVRPWETNATPARSTNFPVIIAK